MARSNTASTSNYLEFASAVVSAYPWTISAWFNVVNVTATHNLVVIGDSSAGTAYWKMVADGAAAGDPVGLYCNAGSTEVQAQTTTSFLANNWNHACAVGISATSRAVYLNGGGKGTNTTSRTPTVARTNIGAYHFGATISNPINGSIGEVGIWNTNLSDGEIWQLSQGIAPWKIRRANLVAYYLPYWDGDIFSCQDFNPIRRRKNDMTITGSMILNSPPRISESVSPVYRLQRMAALLQGQPYVKRMGGVSHAGIRFQRGKGIRGW